MEVIKKILSYPCYCCRLSIKGKTVVRKTCKACKGTGFYKDEVYYYIYTTKNGKQYCVEADTIK